MRGQQTSKEIQDDLEEKHDNARLTRNLKLLRKGLYNRHLPPRIQKIQHGMLRLRHHSSDVQASL